MISLVSIVIAALAVFRVAELIAIDDGPFDVLLWTRAKLGAYDMGDDGRPETSIGRGIICPYCIGVWLALVTALIVAPISWRTILYWFAIAGGQSALQGIAGRNR